MTFSRAMENKKNTPAKAVAFGGMMAALAVILMAMGTILPVATYACPMLCAMLLQIVLKLCGKRMAWAWFGAVAVLSALLAPDKEAASVFAFLGYYPIIKPWLDRRKLSWLWKGALFNGAIFLLYWLLMAVLGMEALVSDFSGMGVGMLAVCLILGNITFFLLDRSLTRGFGRRK